MTDQPTHPEVLPSGYDDPVEWFVRGHHRPSVAIAAVQAHLEEEIKNGERDDMPRLGKVSYRWVATHSFNGPSEAPFIATLVCDLDSL